MSDHKDHDCSKHVAEILNDKPATPAMLGDIGRLVSKVGIKNFVEHGANTPAEIPAPTRRSMLKLAERALFDALDAIALLGRLAQDDPTAVAQKDAAIAAARDRFVRILGTFATIGAVEVTRKARNEDTERPDTDEDTDESEVN